MKRSSWVFVFAAALLFAQPVFAQLATQSSPPATNQTAGASSQGPQNQIIQEMQQADPQAAQAFLGAIQRGDFPAARAIYQEFKKKQKDSEGMDPATTEQINQAIARGDLEGARKIFLEFQKRKEKMSPGAPGVTGEERQEPSLFERTLSGDFPNDILSSGLQQFGYDTFLRTTSSFNSTAMIPVGPDYIIGPGDQFTLTLWGTTEGIYTFTVTKEGNITLPKVGVVPVAGVRFGEIEKTLKRHLSRYYSNFNLSVAMGQLKTITVYVVGEVANPGSYSVNSLTTVYGALFTAGGPTKKGSLRTIKVLRAGKVVKTIDLYDFLLRGDRSQDIRLQHDDTVFVPLIGPVAGVAGSVYRPAIYELKGKETIGDVIQIAGGIMPIASASRVQLYRFAHNEKKVILDIPVEDPPEDAAASSNPQPTDELKEKIRNMDVVNVFPMYDKVWEKVHLSGEVRQPGDYQWRPDLKLKEVILQGQPLPTADLQRAEIVRVTDDFKDRTVLPVNLAALMNGDESQNVPLRPRDEIKVYTALKDAQKVMVTGEVLRPGVYEIYNGERLSDLIRRVGGFTSEAYVYGAVFKRKNVKESQSKNFQSFITRMQTQALQSAAKTAAGAVNPEDAAYAKTELSVNQDILNNLKNIQENLEGRIAITITDNVDEWAGSKDDLLLQDGDTLSIPKRPQDVLVMGEVFSPGAQVYLPDMTVKEYIQRAGGFTKYSEEDQVFVVQANGFAFGKDSPNIGKVENVKLKAGDAVFVPQKVDRGAGLRTTKDIIDIIFKTAVIIATVAVLHL